MTGLCTACGGRTAEAVKWMDGKPYHPGCEPRPMTLIDALAVLAWTQTQGRRLTPEQNEAARKAREIVVAHAEPWVG